MKNNMRRIFFILAALFLVAAGYLIKLEWKDRPTIIANSYNPRLNRSDPLLVRGEILDNAGNVLAQTVNGERQYPYGAACAHVTGYIGISKTGMEAGANYILESTPNKFLSTLASGFRGELPSGNSVALTVNAGLQQLAYDLIGNRNGAAVMIEPSTGRVLCMVSRPSFDPAGVADNWDALRLDESSPLLNRATSGLYPPGSTFKLVTALAALRSGPAYSGFTYTCTGELNQGNKLLHCFDGKAHGEVDLASALAQSCNCYFAQLGLDMGAEALQKAAQSVGFGKPFSFPLGAAAPAFALTRDSSESAIMETAIGQGETLVTPLYLAMFTAAIANDGVLMQPYLLDHVVDPKGKASDYTIPTQLETLMTAAEAQALTELMQGVVESGTARAAQTDAFSIAAKTGTAENAAGADHSWIVAFAPADDPQVAVAVLLEQAGSSGNAPVIAQQLLAAALQSAE